MDFDLADNAFFGIPILTQFLAAVVAMLGSDLPVLLKFVISLSRQQFTFAQHFYAGAGRINAIFLGASRAGDSAPEKREIAVWRQCLF